jgi:hypothetical protein
VNQLDLDDRYGRKRSNLRFLAYAIFAALFGWLLWSASFHSNPVVVSNLLSFNEINEKSMGIKFELTRSNPNQIIDCRLTAVDIDMNIVGEIIHRIPAGAKHEVINTQIPTRVHSVSASVARCIAAN